VKLSLNTNQSASDDKLQFVQQKPCNTNMSILCCVIRTAIDEALALFKKRKPSDRDTTNCRVPPSYAVGSLPMPSEEPMTAFEFVVCHYVHNKRRYVYLSVCCLWPTERLGRSRPNLA